MKMKQYDRCEKVLHEALHHEAGRWRQRQSPLYTTVLTDFSFVICPSEWNADAGGRLSLPGVAGKGPKQGRQTRGRFAVIAKSELCESCVLLR